MSVHILPVAGSHGPVFLVNSRMGHFSATTPSEVAILLPKLRMYFAEFLNADSSVRLRILSSPTCVGLRYGLHMPVLQRLFLGTTTTHTSLCRGIARSQLPSVSGFPWRLLRLAVSSGNFHHPDVLRPMRHPIKRHTKVREYSPASHRLRLSPSP